MSMLATSTPVGLLADRLGNRPVTLAAGIVLCSSTLVQAIPSYPVLLLGRIAFGIAFGAVWTTGLAWLVQFQEGGSSRLLGGAITSAAVGSAVGPALAGVLTVHVGVSAPFVVSGAMSAGVAILLVLLPAPKALATRPAGSATGSPHRLARLALRQPRVVAGAGALVISGAVGGVAQLLVPLQLSRLGTSAADIGWALSGAGLVWIAVSGLVGWLGRRVVSPRVIATTSMLLAVTLIPAAMSTSALWLVGTLVLIAVPRAMVGTMSYALATGDGAAGGLGVGAVIGLLNGAWAAAMVAAPLVAGLIGVDLGLRTAYVVTIVATSLIAGGLVFGSRSFEK
jgi:MFS family permease